MERSTAQKSIQLDHLLLVITAVLLAFGVFMVFDASYARAADAPYTNYDSYFFFKKQLQWAVIGIGFLIFGMHTNYWKIRGYWKPFLVVTLILLVLVLIPGIGKMSNGARRWVGYGICRVQPSEMAKFAIILYLSHHFARKPFLRWPLEDLAIFMGVVLATLALIVKEPDLGTALALGGTAAVLIYLGGARKRLLIGGFSLAAAGIVVLTWLEPYRMGRIMAWRDPWKCYETYGFQVVHSLVALGSGGPMGRGFCQSVQKFHYLPACHTDFIYAIVGEEFGLFGTLGLVALMALFCYCGLLIAVRTRNTFGTLMAAGITSMVCLQSALNIAVVTALVPATGVPLPFISFGGSSLALTLFSVGVLINISRNPDAPSGGDSRYESDSYRRRDRRSHLSGAKRRGSSIQSWRSRDSIRRYR